MNTVHFLSHSNVFPTDWPYSNKKYLPFYSLRTCYFYGPIKLKWSWKWPKITQTHINGLELKMFVETRMYLDGIL